MSRFETLTAGGLSVAFAPSEKSAPTGLDGVAYRERGTSTVWAFPMLAGVPHALTARADSLMLAMVWMRGAVRGITFVADRLVQAGVLVWLSPEEFMARGGRFDQPTDVEPPAAGG